MIGYPKGREFRLDLTVIRAHASTTLAMDPRAIGAGAALGTVDPGARVAKAGTVAIIDVMGPLTQRASTSFCGFTDGYDAIEARVGTALADPSVDAVMLRIDSPGGDAAGCFEAVGRMRAAVAASGKPVYAFADELCASAAMAIACVANAGIFLPPSGVVGSVGVIAMHEDVSAALEGAGVKVTVVKSGAKKAAGNPYEPLSEDAKASLQASVDGLAKQFSALVADARGMKASDVLALEADVFSGKAAVAAGLADEVIGWDAAMRKATNGGRAAAKKRTKMSISKKLGLTETATDAELEAAVDRIVAERAALVQATEKATASEALGVVEAWKIDAAALAAARQDLAASQKKVELQEAGALIDAAFQGRKIVSAAAKAKTEALYAQHGFAVLKAHLEALSPVAAATEHKAAEQKSTGNSDQAPALTPDVDGVVKHNGLAFEAFSNDALHNLRSSDGGEQMYAALRADWDRRGKPARNAKA